MFILANKASILLQLINKNYDTGQTSILFFKGKEYVLTSLKNYSKDSLNKSNGIIIELHEGELESGLELSSNGILVDFQTYREFITLNPDFHQNLFLRIKKKNELDIWKNELCNDSRIIPLVSEYRTDWIQLIFLEKLPVILELPVSMDVPDFIAGFVVKGKGNVKDSALKELRNQLRLNQIELLKILVERRNLLFQMGEIKKQQNLSVFREDIYLKNLLNCYNDSISFDIPLRDTMDFYMLLHEMSVRQQEELKNKK